MRRIGAEIFERARRARPVPLSLAWWQQHGMQWTMQREHLRARLFDFIATLPQHESTEALAGSLRRHLGGNGFDLPWPLQLAVDFDDDRSLHARLAVWAARFATGQVARSFIVGSVPGEAIAAAARMRRQHMACTLDILGETVHAPEAAESYFRRYRELLAILAGESARWPAEPLLDAAPFGMLPRANVSVKLSALSARFSHELSSVDCSEIRVRLRELFRLARRLGAFINVDLEQFALRDATYAVFEELLNEPELRDWPDAGIVVQAYLRDSRADLERLRTWVRRRGAPITVRLVKGAYWDSETALAARQGRPSPLWSEKRESDASFEELTALLIEGADLLRPTFGTHNVRSIAHALAQAEAHGLPPRTIELQMLYGMGNPLKTAVVEMGQRLRVYSPMGAWVPGVAYLVRRLAENTANESFLRQGFLEGTDENELLAPPHALRGSRQTVQGRTR